VLINFTKFETQNVLFEQFLAARITISLGCIRCVSYQHVETRKTHSQSDLKISRELGQNRSGSSPFQVPGILKIVLDWQRISCATEFNLLGRRRNWQFKS
jgi:hypothetical protein